MSHDLLGPVIGIKMTRRIRIPFEFVADGGGMTVQGRSNLLLGFPFPHGLPDVKPFFVA